MAKVILSSTYDDDYLFYVPITAWVWKYFGFDAVVFVPKGGTPLFKLVLDYTLSTTNFVYFEPSNVYSPARLAQCSRLFAGCMDFIAEDEYCLLGDIDMIPLSDYFCRDFDKINYFGHDLTGFEHIPMCYVGMTKQAWKSVMGLSQANAVSAQPLLRATFIDHMLRAMEQYTDNWGLDQDILTDRMRGYGLENCNAIPRGLHGPSHAIGRVDRSYGFDVWMENPIDAHLPRPGFEESSFADISALLGRVFPSSDFRWLAEYREKYVRSRSASSL